MNLLITFQVCTSLALKENCLIEIERRYEFLSVQPLGAMCNSMLWVYLAVPKNNKILRVLMPVTVMCMCGQLEAIHQHAVSDEGNFGALRYTHMHIITHKLSYAWVHHLQFA